MHDYVIMTDSSCDLSPETLAQWGVKCIDLTYREAGSSTVLSNSSASLADFYAEMRKGTVYQTSAVNPAECRDAYEEILRSGHDIVYIAFSSGLSVSKQSAELAAQDVKEAFPSQRIAVVDSLCASAGQGLLVYLAVQKKNAGTDFDSLVSYLTDTVSKMCHWFTVDDLKYLKRGGRISAASAFAATVLDIKPVLHMDDEGHLINMSKVRGRKQAIKALAEKYQELAEDPENGIYYISHADCPRDAAALEELIFRKLGTNASIIADIGPVIGSHAGPGTLALFFVGKHR